MSTYEDDLRFLLKSEFDAGSLQEIGEAAEVFDSLKRFYPVCGSKINWKLVRNAVEEIEFDEGKQVSHFSVFLIGCALHFI